MFGEIIFLCRVIEADIPHFIIHAIHGYHAISDLGDLLQVIAGAGADFSEENIFTCPAPQCHADLVDQLICIVQVLLFRRVLRITQCGCSPWNDGDL